jgi:hypothetical protein
MVVNGRIGVAGKVLAAWASTLGRAGFPLPFALTVIPIRPAHQRSLVGQIGRRIHRDDEVRQPRLSPRHSKRLMACIRARNASYISGRQFWTQKLSVNCVLLSLLVTRDHPRRHVRC